MNLIKLLRIIGIVICMISAFGVVLGENRLPSEHRSLHPYVDSTLLGAPRPLVKDAPQADSLLASTFFGGSGIDGYREIPIAIDEAGYVYVATRTSSAVLPTTPGVYDDTLDGTYDLVIAKFAPDLQSLVACTYLGGSGNEGMEPGTAMTLDADGNLVIATSTSSIDYPTTPGAYCDTLTGGWDVAVSRLSPDLSSLIASTYLGGQGEESYMKVAVTADGRVVLAGSTTSSDFPTTSGVVDQLHSSGPYFGYDVFVSVLDHSLTTLLVSTYLGHTGEDMIEQLVVTASSDFIIGGWTTSTYNFPTTSGAAYPTYRGGSFDGFITRINEDLTSVEASTYIGGSAWDFVYDLTVDASDNVLATGHTASTSGFPVTTYSYDRTYNSSYGEDVGDDAYVIKLDPDLSTVLMWSYLGGSGWENGTCIRTDDAGRVFVCGQTNSTDFPYSPGTFDSTVTPAYKYWSDAWVCCFDSTVQTLLFGSILGGSSNDGVGSVVFDQSFNIYLGGATRSSNFPTTPGAYDGSHNGGYYDWGGDVFLSAFARGYWVDTDDDGHCDFFDNCPDTHNPDQADADGNGTGDACCCGLYTGGYTGNTDCSPDGKRNLSDITRLIDHVYIEQAPLCCPASGNTSGDTEGKVNLSDITELIDHVYINQEETAACE